MKKINIKPLGDNVILQQAQAETKTASGIILTIYNSKRKRLEKIL